MDLYILARSGGMMGKIAAGNWERLPSSDVSSVYRPMRSHPDDDDDAHRFPSGP